MIIIDDIIIIIVIVIRESYMIIEGLPHKKSVYVVTNSNNIIYTYYRQELTSYRLVLKIPGDCSQGLCAFLIHLNDILD